MARRPISMHRMRRILQLSHEMGLGVREIARSLGLSHSTVGKYLQKAREAQIGWPIEPTLGDRQLEALLEDKPAEGAAGGRPIPDWAQMHRELRSDKRPKGLTRRLLWEEYRLSHPNGYSYTQFCELYKRFTDGLDPVFRQAYRGGEKLFVDWAGEGIWLRDPQTGQMRKVHLFVAALGASNYTFAKLYDSMRQHNWNCGHMDAWEFFGGVAAITVPDNARTAVTDPCRYEPVLHRSYEELCEHYGTVVVPARPGKPRDKAKVEKAVQHAGQRILAVLRHRTFFSLAEANAAVREALEALNRRAFTKMPGNRLELFNELDKPALKPLPATRYEPALWCEAKANIDYHVQVEAHCYSVPYTLACQRVEVRIAPRTVEIFSNGQRVALHARSAVRGGFTTDPAHRPKSHQKHLEWTPGRLIAWAAKAIGPEGEKVVEKILLTQPHPERGYRACLGLMRLSRLYGQHRMVAACQRALHADACSYRRIATMLKTGADRWPLPGEPSVTGPALRHENLRGQDYYRQQPPLDEDGAIQEVRTP